VVFVGLFISKCKPTERQISTVCQNPDES